ncbi:MAG: hypothetical protein MI864_22840, partial [Pseudomonadales bacterium]|nr:hypothetical protein [Pseudomonadales bacterium]
MNLNSNNNHTLTKTHYSDCNQVIQFLMIAVFCLSATVSWATEISTEAGTPKQDTEQTTEEKSSETPTESKHPLLSLAELELLLGTASKKSSKNATTPSPGNAQTPDIEPNLTSTIIDGPVDVISLSDYQSLDSIRLEWMDLKEDIQGIKADVEMTIESQVGDIQGAIKLDHFFRSPASAAPPTHDYRYEHQSHSRQSGDQYYD